MNKKASIILLITIPLMVVLSACRVETPQPAITPLPSPTITVTVTASALPTPSPTITHTPTSKPSSTPEPTTTPEAAALPMPEGTPAAEWEGMPIMQGAIAGQGDRESYLFTLEASAKEIQSFYEESLMNIGWSLLGVGEGKTNNLLLIFMKGEETLSIAIITPETEDGILLVMLVK